MLERTWPSGQGFGASGSWATASETSSWEEGQEETSSWEGGDLGTGQSVVRGSRGRTWVGGTASYRGGGGRSTLAHWTQLCLRSAGVTLSGPTRCRWWARPHRCRAQDQISKPELCQLLHGCHTWLESTGHRRGPEITQLAQRWAQGSWEWCYSELLLWWAWGSQEAGGAGPLWPRPPAPQPGHSPTVRHHLTRLGTFRVVWL